MMLSSLKVLWQLRRGSSYSVYKSLKKNLFNIHQKYSEVEQCRRKALDPFLQVVTHDALPYTNSLKVKKNIHSLTCSRDLYPYSIFSTCDEQGRPYQVWRHDHSCRSDVLLVEEPRTDCTLDVAMTRDGQYITINSNSHTSSEVYLMKCSTMEAAPVLVKGRLPNCSYHLEHAHSQYYILSSNDQFSDYKLLVSDNHTPSSWKPHPVTARLSDMVVHDLEVTSKFVVLYCTKGMKPVAVVIDPLGHQEPYFIECGSDRCWMDKPLAPIRFDADLFPVSFSSPSCPSCTLLTDGLSHYNMEEGGDVGIQCTVTRTHAEEEDVRVPITVCHHGDVPNSNSPLLVHLYGCYGENLPMGYRPQHELLLSLGWTIAFCHVRGGGEKGRSWYHAGQGVNKMNSIKDVRTCVRHLHHTLHISQPMLTAVTGRSAGGLVAAMFYHLWPEMLQAAVLQVPLVNVVKALSASSGHFISHLDRGEYGDMADGADEAPFLHSICPFSNLKPQDYPSVYITASKQDDLVSFKDVKEYAKKLVSCARSWGDRSDNEQRNCVADDLEHAQLPRGTVIFNELQGQGHFGSGDMRERATMDALEVLFLHRALHLSLPERVSRFYVE